MNQCDELLRAKEVEGLRERLRPATFDAWLCLGRNYRDEAEAQEWASCEEIGELSSAFSKFKEKHAIYFAMKEKKEKKKGKKEKDAIYFAMKEKKEKHAIYFAMIEKADEEGQ